MNMTTNNHTTQDRHFKYLEEDFTAVKIGKLKRLISKVEFADIDITDAVSLIHCLSKSDTAEAKTLIENLTTFKRLAPWYSRDEGEKLPIGHREIGFEIRLASIKALSIIGDMASIVILKAALEDKGDHDQEFGEVRSYPYRSGVEISKLAKETIDSLLLRCRHGRNIRPTAINSQVNNYEGTKALTSTADSYGKFYHKL